MFKNCNLFNQISSIFFFYLNFDFKIKIVSNELLKKKEEEKEKLVVRQDLSK